ncbi:SIR2 family protein [Exercitatus varius]|uniref:SIR2 family protein n=1 Tax=Exercitatus varius TaxID=67857 RepID=UPI00294AF2FE|nr:SIR2 family protein [Exercitatus varius]MDG2943225.1 SIR2 family protein [Exercitatus varius]
MEYVDALKQIKAGNAMLFYGSGMASDVINLQSEKMPMSKQLADRLSPDANQDLTLASELYIEEHGEDNLINLLRDIFTTKFIENNPPSYYEVLAKENWRSIFTTNYDDSFEFASRKIGKERISVDPEMTSNDYTANSKTIIHVNGFISTLTKEKLNTTFKLTEASYLADQFIKGNWYNSFISEVQASKAIFFIGYSLSSDFDIKKIFFDFNKELKNKTFFITNSPNKILERYGNVIPEGVEKFSESLNKIPYIDIPEYAVEITNFDKFSLVEKDIKDINVNESTYKFLTFGQEDSFLLGKSLELDFNDYSIKRCLTSLKEIDNYRYVILNGDIGSGKTILSKQISFKLIQNGYDVYLLKEKFFNVEDDIDNIIKYSNSRLAFILDINFYNESILNIIRYISVKCLSAKIILTIRSNYFEDVSNDLIYKYKLFSNSETMTINTDVLADEEFDSFISLLKKNGLWSDVEDRYSAVNSNKILAKFKEESNRRLGDILLYIFNSKHIINKFRPMFNELEKNQSMLKILVCTFMLTLIGRKNITRDELYKYTDERILIEYGFQKNTYFKDVFYKEGTYISPSSSLFAKFFFKQFLNPSLLVNTLIELTQKMYSLNYSKIYRSLATYTNIQSMLPEKDKRKNIIKFYEQIRMNLPSECSNPHFWLQYAIARLAYAESELEPHLELAKKYLDTAMDLASKIKSYKTFDLETQLARYHLIYAKSNMEFKDICTENMLMGIQYLDNVTEKDPKRASFRPIQYLCDLIDKLVLDPDKMELLKLKLEKYLNRINNSRNEVKNEKSVRITKSRLDNSIKYLHIKLNS